MNTLGIRVKKREIYLSILDTIQKIIIIEKIKLPKIIDFPTQLKYLRFTLIDILSEYEIYTVGIKITEYTALSKDNDRLFIEGVIQETLATSDVKHYNIENIQSLSKILKIKTPEYKKLLESSEEFIKFITSYNISIKETTNEEKREAALVSIVAKMRGDGNDNRK